MAKAAPKKGAPAKPKQGKPVDRFENDWEGVPNFRLSGPAKKKPAKKK